MKWLPKPIARLVFASGKPRKRMPGGIVRLVSASGVRQGRVVALYELGKLYAVLRVTDDTFSDWLWKYGVGSPSGDGSILIPAFPIFGKVAWMHIDEVRISGSEIVELVRECERALETAAAPEEREAFLDIKALAEEAIAASADMEFGHP